MADIVGGVGLKVEVEAWEMLNSERIGVISVYYEIDKENVYDAANVVFVSGGFASVDRV